MNISTLSTHVAAQNKAAGTAQPEKSPEAGLPDLVIDRFDPSNSWPNQGERIDFEVRVRNAGSAPAGPFLVEVSGDGMAPDRERVSGLNPGQSARVRLGPANVGYGSIAWYDARVDVGNEVVEENESNNWQSTSVSVRDPFPRDPFPRPPIPPGPPRA
jgi:subtilase family serine protease